jgi:UDP-2,3-diacylglucosamine hydrolase
MAVAVIADAHLEGPGGSVDPLLSQLVELPDQGCTRLVLLGDLFQAWIGFPSYETPGIARVVAALAGLRRGGIPVHYVEGNRDFFLAGPRYAEALTTVGRELVFEAAGQRCLAVHGDGLDRRDWKYRWWRRVSKSSPARFLLQHLPRRLAHRTARGTERRLSRTNQEHRREVPDELLRSYGEARLRQGHDLLLLGHFHEERRYQVPSGRIWLVDAWFHSRRVEWLADGAGPAG